MESMSYFVLPIVMEQDGQLKAGEAIQFQTEAQAISHASLLAHWQPGAIAFLVPEKSARDPSAPIILASYGTIPTGLVLAASIPDIPAD